MTSWAKICFKQLTTYLSFPVEGKKWGRKESKKTKQQQNKKKKARTSWHSGKLMSSSPSRYLRYSLPGAVPFGYNLLGTPLSKCK